MGLLWHTGSSGFSILEIKCLRSFAGLVEHGGVGSEALLMVLIFIDQIQQKQINNVRNSASGFIGHKNTFSKNKIFEES